MTDTLPAQPKASPQSRKLVAQTVGPVDKRRHKRGLTRAIRTAIDAIVFERCTRLDACQKAGITERALYLAFEKPEVAAYWNLQTHVLRTGARAETLHRLFDLRDQNSNVNAAVKSCQVILAEDDDARARKYTGAATLPGITVVITNPNQRTSLADCPAVPLIDLSTKDGESERRGG